MGIEIRLKACRERAGLTRRELAHKAGLHYNTIRFIETGKVVPIVTTAIRIANALGISVSEIFVYRDSDKEVA